MFFSHTDDSDGDVAGQVAVKNGRTEYSAAGGDRCTFRIPHGKRNYVKVITARKRSVSQYVPGPLGGVWTWGCALPP